MMKIKRLRNGWIRAKGTLDLVTGDLEVRIQGPEETWSKLPGPPLGKTSSIYKKILRNIFFRDVIVPVHNFLHPRRRGLSYEKEIFTRKMKVYCANLYLLWDSWLKVPRDKWPNPIEEAVSALEKKANKRTPEELKIAHRLELTIDQSKRIKHTYIAKLTAFCAEKYFQRERIRNRFDKWTDNFDTFRRTFITGNSSIAIVKEVILGRDPNYYLKHYKEYLTSNFKATFETLESPFLAGKYLSSK